VSASGLQLSRFGRFGLVGLLGAALQLISLYLLTKCVHLRATAATPLAVEIAILHNFVWHQRFTWSDRSVHSLPQRFIRLCRFQAGNGLLSLFGNTLLIYGLGERLKFPVLPSSIAAILLCSLLNFVVADRWVYVAHPPRV
jgi:putative flippase GtrA